MGLFDLFKKKAAFTDQPSQPQINQTKFRTSTSLSLRYWAFTCKMAQMTF